jgi:hypothetical protein
MAAIAPKTTIHAYLRIDREAAVGKPRLGRQAAGGTRLVASNSLFSAQGVLGRNVLAKRIQGGVRHGADATSLHNAEEEWRK